MNPIFYIILGAAGAEALRLLIEELYNCYRYRRNNRQLAVWLAETHDRRQKENFREVEKFGEEEAE